MLRLVFLVLVIIGALAAVVTVFLGVGYYQVARLQEPEPEPEAAPAAAASTNGTPSTDRAPSTRPTAVASTSEPSADLPAARIASAPPHADVVPKPDPAVKADAVVNGPVAVNPAEKPAPPAAPVQLMAKDGVLIGQGLRLDPSGPPTIVDWSNRGDGVEWTVEAPASGIYDVAMNYACDRSDGGGVFTLRSGRGTATVSIRATAGWEDYQSQHVGKLYLAQGRSVVFIRPVYLQPGGKLMNLRSLTLTFVKETEEPEFRPRRGRQAF